MKSGGHFASGMSGLSKGTSSLILSTSIWGLVTLLGMFGDRSPRVCTDYYDEWKLCTMAEFRATDEKLYAMLTDSRFNLPKVAPNGVYR